MVIECLQLAAGRREAVAVQGSSGVGVYVVPG